MTWLLALTLVQVWRQGAPMPTPGYGLSCVEMDGLVYAIGGFSGEQNPIPRPVVEAYDLVGDTWYSHFAPMPFPRGYAGCCVLGRRIYVIGGTDGQTGESRRVDRFDPVANRWDTVAPLPAPRQALVACVYQGQIYAIGGFRGNQYRRGVYRFVEDSAAGYWEVGAVDSLEIPRANAGITVTDGRICVVGGLYYSSLGSVECYSPDRWQIVGDTMFSRRYGLAAVGYGPWVYAIGGRNLYYRLGSVEVLNLETGQWREGEPLRLPRSNLGAALVGTTIVAIGGKTDMGTSGAVEIHDLFEGVAEEGLRADPVASNVSVTVLQGMVRYSAPGQRIEVFDIGGKLVLAGQDRIERMLPEGTYFVSLRGESGFKRAQKIVVLR
ncbi:MAG: kelch repeat-containing protein [candidate division WOR-3 bacterium]